MAWAWRTPAYPASAKLVLMALADFADEGGRAWPAVPTLSAKTGVPERTVKYAIGKLRDQGLLTVEQRRRGNGSMASNLYCLALVAPAYEAPPSEADYVDREVAALLPLPDERPANRHGQSLPMAELPGGQKSCKSPGASSRTPENTKSLQTTVGKGQPEGGPELPVGTTPRDSPDVVVRERALRPWTDVEREVLSILLNGIDGLPTDEPCKRPTLRAVGDLMHAHRASEHDAIAAAWDARQICQAQGRAPNIAGLFATRLERLSA